MKPLSEPLTRLIEALQTHRNLSPNDLVAAIFDEVRRFSPYEQRDDFTLIVARCKDGNYS